MKKELVLLVTIFAVALFIFTGCGVFSGYDEGGEYTAYFVSQSDSHGVSDELEFYSLWTSGVSYGETSIEQKASVVFEGKTYTADCYASWIFAPNLFVSHAYSAPDCHTEINSETGEVSSFLKLVNVITRSFSIDENEARKWADSFVKN